VKGDLHVHTCLSDGSLMVAEALAEAQRAGLGYISLVDHDTVAGTAEALELAPRFGLLAIPGIEISAYDPKRGRKAHILGYAYRLPASALRAFCGPILAARDALTRLQIGMLAEAGYPVSVAEVEELAGPSTALYKQHVMAILTRKGAADGIYGEMYRKLFKGGGICAREIDYPDAFAAVEAINADGAWRSWPTPARPIPGSSSRSSRRRAWTAWSSTTRTTAPSSGSGSSRYGAGTRASS
jgi:predicted metal-dependent phosphoesterase TrpH